MNHVFFILASVMVLSPSLIDTAETVAKCTGEADIVFVVDASGSIGYKNFQKVLKFITQITTYFTNDTLGPIRFGLVTFSDAANIEFDLYKYNDSLSLRRAIASIPYIRGYTRTDKGLDTARNMFRDNGRPHVIILLTDGQSSSRESTKAAADRLRETKIKTLSIGVTDSINEEELYYISGPNAISTVDNFDLLQGILNGLVQQTCESIGGEQIPVVDPAPPTPTAKESCRGSADVIFVVDGSGSIGANNFKIVLNFIQRLTRIFSTGGVLNFNIGMVVYSYSATKLVDPYSPKDLKSLEEVIDNATYPAKTTRTDLGLDLARSMFLDNGRLHVILLVTDGLSSNRAETKRVADVLRAENITTLSVGVTDSIDERELRYISGPGNVFTVDEFNQLQNVVDILVEKTCDAIVGTTTPVAITTPATSSEDTTPATTSEDTTTATTSEDTTPASEDSTTATSSEGTTSATTSEATTPASTSENTTPASTSEDTTTAKTSEDTTPATTSEDSTTAASSEGTTSATTSEATTPASTSEDTTSATTGEVTTLTISTAKESCGGSADVIFVVDGSGSIGANNFKIVLNFIQNLTRIFSTGGVLNFNIGMVVYSDIAIKIVDPYSYRDVKSLDGVIGAAHYPGKNTRTDLGLDLARSMFFDNGRLHVILLVTDGLSSNRAETKRVADVLRAENIVTHSVGVTDSIDERELRYISGSGNFFTVEEFYQLQNVVDGLVEKTCEAIVGTTTTFSTTITTPESTSITLITTTETVFCPGQADIIFVVDASGSVGFDSYKIVLSFVATIADFLTGSQSNDFRFGMVVYSDDVTVLFDLNNTYINVNDLQMAILSAPYLEGSTRTDKGLNKARDMILRGGRSNASHFVILLTEGETDKPYETLTAAQKLKVDSIIAVSVTVNVAIETLELISLPENIFSASDFPLLQNRIVDVIGRLCEIIEAERKTTTFDVIETTVISTPEPSTTAVESLNTLSTNGETDFCPGQADIIFVVDASGSVGLDSYKFVLSVIATIADILTGIQSNEFRFGMVVYSDDVTVLFDLNNTFINANELEMAILSAPYIEGSTRTEKGLNQARDMILRGGRSNASHLVILMTEGEPEKPYETMIAAQKLKVDNIIALSVGVNVAITTLQHVSLPEHIFSVSDFPLLLNIISDVAGKLCEIIKAGRATTAISTDTSSTVVESTSTSSTTEDITTETTTTVESTFTASIIEEMPLVLCPGKADIVFVVDASGSIGEPNYEMVLSFVTNIVDVLTRDVASDVRFGMVIYGEDAVKVFDLNSFTDTLEIKQAITNAPYLASSTSTDKGLNLSRDMLVTGGRREASLLVILLTDGISNSRYHTKLAAESLRDYGITALTVGITGAINQFELDEISEPGNVFLVDEFSQLKIVLVHLIRQACEIVGERPTESPPSASTSTTTLRTTAAPPVIQCTGSADIVFVLDASGSIGDVQFQMVVSFVQSFIMKVSSGGLLDIRFGLVIFSDEVQKIVELNNYNDLRQLVKVLDTIPYPGGFTRTDKGLYVARNMFLQHGRANSPHVVILMTDGQSTSRLDTQIEAQNLRTNNVSVISIGLGNNLDQLELDEISETGGIIVIPEYDNLKYLLGQLINKLCQTIGGNSISNIKPLCRVKADIVFITDSSGSIGLKNYKKVLNFAVNFTSNFIIGKNDVQVAHVIFGNQAKTMFNFNDYSSHAQLKEAFLVTPYLSQTTNTDKALDLVATGGILHASFGARPDSKKIAIVTTDGRSHYPELTKVAAKRLREKGVTIIAIGIVDALTSELRTMASTNRDVFEVQSFDSLDAIVQQVSKRICPSPSC